LGSLAVELLSLTWNFPASGKHVPPYPLTTPTERRNQRCPYWRAPALDVRLRLLES